MVKVSGDTFVWCVWGTCYLPPQLSEVVAHHLHFDLVFTRLWTTMKVKNLMRSILYVSWDVKYETTLVWLLARRLVEDTGDLLGKTTSSFS